MKGDIHMKLWLKRYKSLDILFEISFESIFYHHYILRLIISRDITVIHKRSSDDAANIITIMMLHYRRQLQIYVLHIHDW